MKIQLQSPPEAHYTVYKLTDPEGKIYIGFTGANVNRRWNSGWGYKGGPIREAIDRFGWKNFKKEVLCDKLIKEGAEKLEKWFIEYYDSMDPEKGYNRYTGGSREGAKASILSRERHRQTLLAIYATDPDYCQNNREICLAYYKEHPEAKKKISLQVSAYLLSPEGRRFPEACTRPRPVRCVETGEVFRSQRSAEKTTGYTGIHKACSGIQSISGGYHWEYVTTEEAV